MFHLISLLAIAASRDCQIYDHHVTLGDYYSRPDLSTNLLFISFKTSESCPDYTLHVFEGTHHILKSYFISHPIFEDEIEGYHHTTVISKKDQLSLDTEYVYRIVGPAGTSKPYRLRIPQKVGQSLATDIIVLTSELLKDQVASYEASHLLLMDGEDETHLHQWSDSSQPLTYTQSDEYRQDFHSFDIQNIHFIQLKATNIQSVLEALQHDLEKVRGQTHYQPWIVIFSEGLQSFSILDGLIKKYKVDLHIPVLRSSTVSFRLLQEDIEYSQFQPLLLTSPNSAKRLTVLDENNLQVQEIVGDEVMRTKLVQRLLQTDAPSSTACQPYGMRLSIGYYYTFDENPNDMMEITFNTLSWCPWAFIMIWDEFDFEGIIPINQTKILNMTKIYENGPGPYYDYVTFINIIKLGSHNTPGENRVYYYSVHGDANNSAGPFVFKIPSKAHDNKEHKFMFFGDMDSNWQLNNSNYTFNFLQARANRAFIEDYDLMMFMGDMAYDLESNNCQMGDDWLRNISSFAAYYPFMAVPGNHDSGNNSDYPFIRRAFQSPRNPLDTPTYFNDFFSFDLGLAHFISFNPDWIVYQTASQEYFDFVLNLFEADLIKAQANREKVPWIIVNSHYPMYCSDNTNWMCGQNWVTLQPFAELFTKYNVEVFMSAHQHSYERDSPFINNQTASFETDGPAQHVIKNSNAPVYIIEGAGGNDYFMPSEPYPVQPYTIAQSIVDGVGVITIKNATHLLFEHIIAQNNTVADFVWVIQDRPSPSPDFRWLFLVLAIVIFIIIVICYCYFKRREKYKAMLLP